MVISSQTDALIGEWRGTNRLHLSWMPDEKLFESESTASIEHTARGRFLKIDYDWSYRGERQEGLILMGAEKKSGTVKTFWIDSWHMGNKFMVSEGRQEDEGYISVKGSYSVPDSPDWGWRTDIRTENENSLKIVMYNISPEGEEDLAVEAFYQRAGHL